MGCQVCRARKVKCDGRLLHGCLNCARLDLACDFARDGAGRDASREPSRDASRGKSASPRPKRTYRSCTSCRAAKTKCNGDHPACLRCRARAIPCVYGATSGPMWTRVLLNQNQSQSQAREPLSPGGSSNAASAASEHAHMSPPALPTTPSVTFAMEPVTPVQPPLASAAPLADMPDAPDAMDTPGDDADPHALTWLYAAQLPEDPELLRRAVDHYFSNVHPLRCFAFVHKPSFMRQLDAAGFRGDALGGSDETALLQIVCAHGAKFCALAYSETAQRQPAKLIQAAGHEWAKAAEQTLMTNYGRITVTSLMTAVLLYDYRYRLGDFAHALMMSGLTTRMAHALQLNMEYTPRHTAAAGSGEAGGDGGESSITVLSPVEKEARRRLMWACYVIDTWTGSGMDQLTLLREYDMHIQLPCNERDFLFQRAVVTRRLGHATPDDDSHMGMMSSYIRIVSIWKRVARYVKHLDTAALPWLPDSEFAVLDEALRAWREGLAPYLDFSPDSIYTRLESSQLGALALLHCTYYNAMLDLYRVAVPELFSLRHAFRFPPEQTAFLHSLQARSFRLACGMATVLAKTAAQGARHLADSMTPMFAYNSSRVMLYYLVRLHDPSRPDTRATVEETIQHVQSNNRVLQLASAMMPLSEPLLITARRWLQKLQSGLHKQDAAAGGSGAPGLPGLADPTAADNPPLHQHQQLPQDADHSDGADSADSTDTPDNVLHPLSLFRLARKTLNDKAYSEPSSRASYAGGGLPPLRDVASHGRSVGGRPSSPGLERPNGAFAPPLPLPPPPPPPAAAPTPATAPTPVAYTNVLPAAAPTPGGLTNWESAFDDLATGLHVLQDYPHWDINGFDHISSNVFDSTGLATTWPEYRSKLP